MLPWWAVGITLLLTAIALAIVLSVFVERYENRIIDTPTITTWNRILHWRDVFAYQVDLVRLARLVDKKYRQRAFTLVAGDNITVYPNQVVFAKARRLGDSGRILLPLNFTRHFGPIKRVASQDCPFHDKRELAVWRGSTTGPQDGPRFALVQRWGLGESPHVDVGFNDVIQGARVDPRHVKLSLTRRQQLKDKYLISVQGNDVASGLQWMLASNRLSWN